MSTLRLLTHPLTNIQIMTMRTVLMAAIGFAATTAVFGFGPSSGGDGGLCSYFTEQVI